MVSAGNVHGFLRAYAIRRKVPVQANDSDTPNCFSSQYSRPVQTMGTRFALPALGVDASSVKLSLIGLICGKRPGPCHLLGTSRYKRPHRGP
jgi:hypothetical protein